MKMIIYELKAWIHLKIIKHLSDACGLLKKNVLQIYFFSDSDNINNFVETSNVPNFQKWMEKKL